MSDLAVRRAFGPNEWLVDEIYEQYRDRSVLRQRDLAGLLRWLPTSP